MDRYNSADERIRRISIDGRFAFGLAILLSGIGLLALMDRIGVPDGLVTALAIIFVVSGLMTIAALLRSMRVSSFYAAGRAIPPPYAGLAMASLCAALFLPFLGWQPSGASLSALFSGFACGVAIAALITGPFLRKTGAFSIPDLIAERFPKLAARLGTILLTAAVALLIGLSAYQEALSLLSQFSGLSRPVASLIVAALLAVMILPGGLASTIWIAAAAACVSLAALGLPLLISACDGAAFTLPLISHADIWTQISVWPGFPHASPRVDVPVIAASAFGVGTLAPLLSPAIACQNRRSAQRAGVAALGWGGVLILLTFITLTQVSVNPDQASTTKATVLLSSYAKTSGFGAALSGMVSAALLALSLALAAASIQTGATVLGNDLFYRVRDQQALTSRRLAVTRGCAIIILALIGITLRFSAISPQTMTALAIVLSASGLAPLLILTLWPRAASVDATVTLLTGLLTAEALIELSPSAGNLDWIAVSVLISAATGLAAGMATSLSRPSPINDEHTFAQAMMNNAGEWLHPDKGA